MGDLVERFKEAGLPAELARAPIVTRLGGREAVEIVQMTIRKAGRGEEGVFGGRRAA